MNEFQHQCTVFKWAAQPFVRERWPCLKLLHHVPNGGTRDTVEAKNLKRAGVKPGVPDLDLPVARGKYHGLRIEMKTEAGTESVEQCWWREELTAQGYFATVCHGWSVAVRVIEWYLDLKEGQL